jgi:anti-sigma factor RsiW
LNVDCTLDRHLLDGYLDGELGFERALEVEAHVASCPNCASQVEGWKQVRAMMQRADIYHRAPAALEEKVRKLASTKAPTKGTASWLQRWLWAAGGAAFATAALLGAFLLSRPVATVSEQEIVTDHVRSLMANHLMDVVSTDQHTVKPWFDGKLEFAPPVQDFAAQGYPLAGGRMDYLSEGSVAVLVYHRALHVINLYVWPAADAGAAPIEAQTIHGYNVLSWKRSGFQFRAVSDLNLAELRDFANLVSP